MKVRRNTLSLALIVLLGTSCFNLYASAAQSVTTASSATQSMGTMSMTDTSNKDYWNEVAGEDQCKGGKTRYYYIAAEETVWDYAPDKTNVITGTLDAAAANVIVPGPTRIGSQYVKCLYQEYTNSKFTQKKVRSVNDQHLGFLGPIIRAEVGDTIKVVFLNKCKFPASVHPHAVFYTKDNEGAPYNDGTTGRYKADDIVQPQSSYTYTWCVNERAGPGPMDGSSIMWMYHSHVNEVIDFYAGLVGAMAITRKGMGKADGSPKDVDRELFIMYSVANENNNPYIADSFKRFATDPTITYPPADPSFAGSNNKDAINGYIYGNGPMITLYKGEHVRWYVMSMGGFGDGHTPAWHGNTVLVGGMRMDVISLLAAEMVTADMCPDNVGIWLFHCHVSDHLNAGMVTRYQVKY